LRPPGGECDRLGDGCRWRRRATRRQLILPGWLCAGSTRRGRGSGSQSGPRAGNCPASGARISAASVPTSFNVLLAPGRVLFIDWPHARLGAPIIDLLTLLSGAAADGLDPEPFLRRQTLAAQAGPHAIDAVLAAHAGFCLADALHPPPPGLEPVYAAKLALGLGTIRWLQRRLTGRPGWPPGSGAAGITGPGPPPSMRARQLAK